MAFIRSGDDILGDNLIPANPDGASPSMTHGFTWIPAGDGEPTGRPDSRMSGHSVVPMYFCKRTHRLYIHNGHAWLHTSPLVGGK
jgi:hypothetical protein